MVAKRKASSTNAHSKMGDSIRNAGQRLDEYAEVLGDKSDEFANRYEKSIKNFNNEAKHLRSSVKTYIKKHPMQTTLTACAIGLILGRLLKK